MSVPARPLSAQTKAGLWLALAVGLADQASKWLILDFFANQGFRHVEITPFFNLVLARNPGISFGMFGAVGAYSSEILIVVTLVIMVALAVWLRRAETRMTALGLGAVIGGAVGNVIDRFRFGGVTDFLDLHILGYHWPAFNVADSAIVLGALALIWESLFLSGDRATDGTQEDQ